MNNNVSKGINKPAEQDSQVLDFKMERLRFVLQQIDRLNERLDKRIALYQTLMVAIVSGIASIYVGRAALGIDDAVARTGIYALLVLAYFVTAFVIVLTVVGVLSWRNYRNDEVAIFDDVVRPGYRGTVRMTNFWRWHETYLVLFLACVPVGLNYFVVRFLLRGLG